MSSKANNNYYSKDEYVYVDTAITSHIHVHVYIHVMTLQMCKYVIVTGIAGFNCINIMDFFKVDSISGTHKMNKAYLDEWRLNVRQVLK